MTYASNACQSCITFRDALGNQIQQCSCPVSYGVQYYQDEECACQRVSNLLANTSSLSCYNCSVGTQAKPVSLLEKDCQCVNAFDASTNKTYLSCVCKNVPQCVDPDTLKAPVVAAPAAPCLTSYPCSCAQNSTSSTLACTCTNPTERLSAPVTLNSTQCACQLSLNTTSNTFGQDCQCCLADEFVRTKLVGPVKCSQATDIKEACTCRNQTISNNTRVSTLSCDCQHPDSKVVSNNLQFPSEGMCDCDNYTLGTKACQCCVAQEIQIQQQQPVCAANSSIQTCQLQNGVYTCQNSRNGFTFSGVNANSSQCFCLPARDNSMRTCNCCLSESNFQQVRPTCSAGRDASSCKCDNVNGTLACSCVNQYFFNQPSNASYAPSQCACYG
jgi:hypothetical protein